MSSTVTIFGGTGFLGRAIVRRLVEMRVAVRIASRRPNRFPLDQNDQFVSTVRTDVRDEASVATAIEGSQAVVNAVGLYLERGAETFDAVHVKGALNVARQAAVAGIGRLVHISGIGADPASKSRYVRARAQGEIYVREAFETTTIVRPSALFGPGDAFLNAIDTISRVAPIFPLFGSGGTRLQPVYVGDVADAVARILDKPATRGRVCELGGPRIYTYRELIQSILAHRDGWFRYRLPSGRVWPTFLPLLRIHLSPETR